MMTFPFVVGSVGPERLGYWAHYAAAATTQSAFDLVSRAYRALWWEEQAASHYREVLRMAALSPVDVVTLLDWLDLMVSTLGHAIERWEWAAEGVEQAAEPDWPAYGFVRDQAIALQDLRHQVVAYVLAQCEMHGLEVPEHCAEMAAA